MDYPSLACHSHMTKPSGHSLVIIPTAVNLTASVPGPHTLSEIMTEKEIFQIQ